MTMSALPLSAYADALKPLTVSCSGDFFVPVRGITNDSRRAAPGVLFCAIRGAKADGHRFLPDAVRAGICGAVIAADSDWAAPDPAFPVLRVRDPYYAWALLCETFYGRPGAGMDVFAVTGTNGKTTIAFLLRRLLRAAFPGENCGLLSTVEYDTGSGSAAEEASRTTPDAETFQRLFVQMKANGCRRAAMELSSHGLHQHRTGSLAFAGAVFTNLTGDHLDYHGTMENYYQAKRILFTELLRPDAPAVVNADDEYGRRLRAELAGAGRKVYAVSLHGEPGAEIAVSDLKLSSSGADFQLRTPWWSGRVRSTLTGEYNVCNLVSAGALAMACGVKPEIFVQIAAQTQIAPPGRLEALEIAPGVRAFVDYAHTDDALFRVLTALRQVAERRIITVFGCGGDRDRTKRPRMAAVAAKLSDLVIITSDNPRTEDPLAIIEDIRKGLPPDRVCRIEPDRAKALELAAELAQKGDLVLAAGKGHENYQEINGVKHPFDDREIIRSIRERSVR
ncbi:MAG: UDP-N-acetylmuramoyl-L-alanyl-D-glutamate--2,6-diaminopimelate ligase [Lentisphaeria bacterium]|nr:UDP-N-acetylmuramoyl-L-alanyl-D-glutamate--2,6-diaminopimelate ligase [Lentisphaeria bacterium]